MNEGGDSANMMDVTHLPERAAFAFDPFCAVSEDAVVRAGVDAALWRVVSDHGGSRIAAALATDWARTCGGTDVRGGMSVWVARNATALAVRIGLALVARRLQRVIRRDERLLLGDWPGEAGWSAVQRIGEIAREEECVPFAAVPLDALSERALAAGWTVLAWFADTLPEAEGARLRVHLEQPLIALELPRMTDARVAALVGDCLASLEQEGEEV